MAQITKDTVNVSRYVMLFDVGGSPKTGHTITDLDLTYVRAGALPAAKVDATALGSVDAAHENNKAIEVDATNMPGMYRVDWPDAAFATGVDQVQLYVKGTNLQPCDEEIELTGVDLLETTIATVTDQTHFVLTAGADFDHAYKDQTVVLRDVSNNDYPSVRLAAAYAGGTLTVTLDAAPDFTVVAGDGVQILAARKLADGEVTAAKLGADCLTADKIADDAFAAEHFAGDCFTAAMFDDDLNVYEIELDFDKDDTNSKDRYGVTYKKNGVPLTAGVTVAKITVAEPSVPNTIINNEDLTDEGSHEFTYTAEGAERIALGLLYRVTISATIDGATRTFQKYIKRDAP